MMFRVIGGVVVYGLALYGAVALVNHLKKEKGLKAGRDSSKRGLSGAANERDELREERQNGTQVEA